jgi:hypothetical protein
MEEKMARQNWRAQLAIGGALALGVVCASLPAFAQGAYQYPIGRSANDGGMVVGAVNTNPPQQYYNYAAPQPADYHYPIGRSANDGGMAPGSVNTNPQPQNYSYSPSRPGEYHYPIGRSLNDGGMVAAQ